MASNPISKAGSVPSDARRINSAYTPSEGSTVAAASERSPLLGSRSTSPTLRDVSPAGLARYHSERGNGRDAEEGDSNGDDDDDVAQHQVTSIRAVCICLSMGMLMFMQAINLSGMTIIQGHVAADLEAYESAMWFTSAYMIAMASTSPLAGRLATIFSLANMVMCAAVLFALGAILSSRATSFPAFVLGRVLTGAGGGCIMTLALILVLQLTSRKRRGLFVGMVNAGFTAGVSTGAIVFGALLPVLGWRELFLVQAPLALLSGVAVYFSIVSLPPSTATQPQPTAPGAKSSDLYPPTTTLQKLKTIDYAGALSLTATIVLFLYGLAGTIQPLPIILSLLTLAFFLLNEYRLAIDPLIPVSILQSRGVLLSCLSQLGLMSARWTVLFYGPIFVLAVRGLPPTIAGAVLIPTNAGFAVGGVLVGWLHVRRAGSFWLPCLIAIALFGLALSGLAVSSTAASPAGVYIALVFANGFATGAALNYTLAQLLHVSAPGTQFITTGLLATFRGFAGSFGTSIGGGVFGRTLRKGLEAGFRGLDGVDAGQGQGLSEARKRLITRLVGSPNLVFAGGSGGLSDAEREVAIRGYEGALRTVYWGAVGVTVLVLVLQAGTGRAGPEASVVADGREEEHREEEEDEEFREEIAEHDGRMEA